jgi:hypothetical protein
MPLAAQILMNVTMLVAKRPMAECVHRAVLWLLLDGAQQQRAVHRSVAAVRHNSTDSKPYGSSRYVAVRHTGLQKGQQLPPCQQMQVEQFRCCFQLLLRVTAADCNCYICAAMMPTQPTT